MLSNNDIRIVYLEFLQREPTDYELSYGHDNFNSEIQLTEYIKSLTEYKINFLKPSKFTFEYQDDVISLPVVNDNLNEGKLLSNNKLGFITTGLYNKFKNRLFAIKASPSLDVWISIRFSFKSSTTLVYSFLDELDVSVGASLS